MSEDGKKLTPQERLMRAIDEAHADDALEEVMKMTPAQLAKELADTGVDMDVVTAQIEEALRKKGIDLDLSGKRTAAGKKPSAE